MFSDSFFPSTALTICAIVFLTMIMLIIRNKLKPDTIESKIYIYHLYLTMIILLLELLTGYTMINRNSMEAMNDALCYTYVYLSFIWEELFVFYTYFLLRKKSNNNTNIKNKALIYLLIGICIIWPMICVLSLGLGYVGGENGLPCIIQGGAMSILHTCSFTGAISIIILLSLNKSNIKNLNVNPLLLLFGLFTITYLLQVFIDFNLNISGFMFTLIMIVLYFTVESQDAKLMDVIKEKKIEADNANRVKTEFLMNISHEIRTPLNTILGFSDAILESDNLNYDQVKDDLNSIRLASINLLNLINNILDISRIESGKEILIEKDYNLENVIYEINSYINAKINKDELKYNLIVDENVPRNLYGDNSKLTRIIILVLANAVKYTNYGEIKLEISGTEVDDDYFEYKFHVSNTGHAMKMENYEKDYFDFVKLNDVTEANFDNALLGLIIAKRLVKLMNGNIEFINQPGMGTQYIIKIKQKKINDIKIGNLDLKHKHDASNEYSVIDCSGKNALIVDDNRLNINVASRIIKRYNFNLDDATNGKDAINMIKNKQYDIIFLDHMMPDMDGVEILSNLKLADIKLPPIIALTANNYDGLKEEYLAKGFTDYLAKPIEFSELNRIIENVFKDESR